jgi:surfactin synthase thioesterase subunit
VELVVVQLPGRETRLRELPLRRISDAVAAVSERLASLSDKPMAFFGHSMGAVLAWGVAQAMVEAGRHTPLHVVLSGRRAPTIPDPDPPLSHLPDDRFVEELNRRYGGIPTQVAADREMMALLLPGLRADIEALEKFKAEAGPPLDVPLTVLGGSSDQRAQPEDLEAWRDHTLGPFRVKTYSGGHFYLNEHRSQVVNDVLEALSPWLPANAGMRES